MNSYSLDYIDDLYVQYVRDPSSVSDTWRQYFEQFLVVSNKTSFKKNGDVTSGNVASGNTTASQDRRGSTGNESTDQAIWMSRIQDRVNQLVREYRVRGHLAAQLDPLGILKSDSPELSPQLYGISDQDLERPLDSSALENVTGSTLHAILTKLQNTYCRSIGAQFMHIDNRNIRDWLQKRMETTENRLELSHQVQRRIYARLADASSLYAGNLLVQKRSRSKAPKA